jgi:hypothetical protein
MNDPEHFTEWLNALLAERQQLGERLHKRVVALRHADSAKQVPALEEEIAELVESSLSLSKREAPGAPALVAVATDLLYNRYGSPEIIDEPDSVWKSWGHANVKTSDWPTSLKRRLLLLTAPLDKVLAERLESYKAQSAT